MLGLGSFPRTLTSPRRETRLRWSTLQISSMRDKGKKVRGGTPPRIRQTQAKCILKQLKYVPWTREREENSKYLRKSCHHHIKCTAVTFLTALMWKRPLNNVALTAATYRRLKGVFGGMGAQVGSRWSTNVRSRWSGRTYIMWKNPHEEGTAKKRKRILLHVKNLMWWSVFISKILVSSNGRSFDHNSSYSYLIAS